MLSPGKLNLGADRYTPFSMSLSFTSLDLTGAVMKAQVRDRRDGGDLQADLATVTLVNTEGLRLAYADTDTVANHIAAGRLNAVPAGLTSASNLFVSQVTMRINEATMEAMPYDSVRGDDLVLYWDLHITPSGGVKQLYLYGDFTVRAGVTQ